MNPSAVAYDLRAAAHEKRPCRVWLGRGLLVVLALLVYARVYDAQFVPMDDRLHITGNPHLTPPTWHGLQELWSHPYGDLYVPLSYTFFAAEAWLAMDDGTTGEVTFNPAVFHVGNVLIHAGCALLVHSILLTLVRHTVAAWLGAALFVVHPLQVESVAWISETRGTLAALFALGSIHAYLRSREAPASMTREATPAGVAFAFPVAMGDERNSTHTHTHT